ncbi:MAG: hypothetical protein QW165_01215 [Candidatus Woesearchaeota archaeon]
MKSWQKEAYRDIESLGSIVFVIIVAARSLVGFHWRFFLSLLFAVILSYLFWQLLWRLTGIKASTHVSNASIMFIIISGFYQSIGFAVFTLVVGLLLLYSHAQLRKHRKGEMLLGIVNGVISAGLGSLCAYLLLPKP